MANVTVTITKDFPDRATCTPDIKFVASRGDTVTFTFPEEPEAVLFFAKGAIFGANRLNLGEHQVLDFQPQVSPKESVKYQIQWTDTGQGSGSGNGTGEIPHP